MRFKHRTVRDVERDLGWGRGTLNRIFAGRSELKLRHILEVAATLDLTPEEFFHMAYAVLPKGATTVERVVAMLEVLGQRAGVKPKHVPAPPEIDLEAVAPIMEDMMRRLLAEMEAGKETGEAKPSEPREPKAPARKRARKPRKKKSE
jgi:transcriptional regulator with XRE-family HTH domain